MPFDRNKAKDSINKTFGYNYESPAYSAWANMQQKELDQRKGDGYSPWEYMTDSVVGSFDMARRKLADYYDDGGTASPRMDVMLERMRAISDKQQNPNYQPSYYEQKTINSWNDLRKTGKLP